MQQLMGGMGLGISPHFLEMKYDRPCLKSFSVVDLMLGFKLAITAHTRTHTHTPPHTHTHTHTTHTHTTHHTTHTHTLTHHTHTHTHTHTQSPTACELVRQHVASGGVYDPGNGKWHGVSDVSYLCTTHTTPCHQLRPQFMKHFAVVHWDGYR